MEFLKFVRKPSYEYNSDRPLSLKTVTQLYLLVFLFSMILFAPISTVLGISNMPHAIETMLEQINLWQMFGIAVIVAPIMEEFIFRFHLRYPKLIRLYVLIALMASILLVYGFITYGPGAFKVENVSALVHDSNMTKLLAFSSIIALASWYLLSIAQSISGQDLMVRFFPHVFYLSAAIFGLVHVSNFQLEPERWYIAPLLVMPQLILAIYLGYVRVRNGIYHSIYVHALNNCIPISLLALGSYLR